MATSNVVALERRARQLIAEGQYEDALALYAHALAADGNDLPYIVSQHAAELTEQLGDHRAAAALWAYVHAHFVRRGDRRGQLHAVLARMRIVVALGAHDEARLLFLSYFGTIDVERATDAELFETVERALGPTPKPDALTLARCEAGRTLALYHASIGRLSRAKASIQLTLRHAKHASQQARPWTLHEESALFEAELAVDTGELKAADSSAPEGLPPNLTSRWQLLRVRALTLMGDLSRARELAQQQRRAASPGTRTALHAAHALAWVLLALNRIGDVLELIDETTRAWQSTDPRRRSFEHLRALALLRAKIGERDEVVAFVPQQVWDPQAAQAPALESRTTAPVEPRSERFVDVWSAQANAVLLVLASDADASAALADARRLAERSDSALLAAKQGFLEALVAYHAANARTAEHSEFENLAVFARIRAQAATARAQCQRLGLALDAWQASRIESFCTRTSREDYEAARALSQRAFEALEQRLTPEDRVFFSLNKSSARDEYVVTTLRRAGAVARSSVPLPILARWFEQRRVRAQALAALESLSTLTQWAVERDLDVAADEPDLETALAGHQVEAWVRTQLAIRRTAQRAPREAPRRIRRGWLAADEGLLQFYVGPDAVFCVAVSARNAWIVELPVTRVRLDITLRRLHGVLQEEGARLADSDSPARQQRLKKAREARRAVLCEASQLLGIEALAERLGPKIRRLFIVPHDVLTNLPFAALKLHGGCLMDRFAISLVPSTAYLTRRARRRAPSPVSDVLAVGIESFAPRALAALAHTVPETHDLAQLGVTRVRTLREPAATRERVLSELNGTSHWIHFATHAEFDLTQPHASRLHLASDGSDRPWLTVSDTARGDWRAISGVVMSACTASVQVALPGQELVGFPSAWLHAGVEHVLAPLWLIDDTYARRFMIDWYKAAVVEGPADALANVQRAWANSVDPLQNVPHRWAGFVHHGV